MAVPDIPDGHDPAERAAPRRTASATVYANKDKVTKYYNPTRYYGPWSEGKTYACSNDAPYSSINESGVSISTERCANGNTVLRIDVP